MTLLDFLRKKEKRTIKFTDFVYRYISKLKTRSNAYKRSYRNVARHIERFSMQTGIELNTDSFTESVMLEFVEFLKTQNLRQSTIATIVQKVISILYAAQRAGYPVTDDFNAVRIKTEHQVSVYLSVDELRRINELKNLSKEAKAVRDRFLIGCFTGLRWGDLSKVSAEDFSGDFFRLKTRKTGEVVVLPIHPVVREILNRNKNGLPPIKTQQSFNQMVKRLCKKAGITELILLEYTKGGRPVRKKVKKYELTSSHTARRSAATNMYIAGIPTARIMLLTGHRTEEAFFRYIRIRKEENAVILRDHDFFK